MNALVEPSNLKEQDAARSLAATWGWDSPPGAVLVLAEKSLSAQTELCGQTLVNWGLIESHERDRLIEAKPKDVPTLEYISKAEPIRVLPFIEQVRALENGYPFYEELKLLSPHPGMEDPAVFARCEKLDAVLMLIETRKPVLIFTTFKAMLSFRTIGKSEQEADPISIHLKGAQLQTAVGSSDDVSALLKEHHESMVGADEGEDEATSGRTWHVKADDLERSPEEREVARICDHALTEDASDISFTPLDSGAVEVYIRKFGLLMPAFKRGEDPTYSKRTLIDSQTAARAINFLQARSGANPDHGRLRVPADGNMHYRSHTNDAFFRLSFIPLNHLNEYKPLRSVSIRLFPRRESALRLQDLRVPANVIQMIVDAVSMPNGFVLVSGPVNQGKSSTLAAAIGEIHARHGYTKKIISVEDPIERRIKGVTQIQVPSAIKDPAERFNVVLRALKRHDFNVLFLGEIRDSESADFGVRFSSSGHLFLSTVHAKDSIVAFEILEEMVNQNLRFQLAEAMTVSISQRLLSTVCDCGTKDCIPSAEDVRLFEMNCAMLGETREMPRTYTKVNPAGCEKCILGYNGSVPAFEVLQFTREVKDAAHALRRTGDPAFRKVLAASRSLTLFECALEYVRAGVVDLHSALFL